jgi:hypothetical protein
VLNSRLRRPLVAAAVALIVVVAAAVTLSTMNGSRGASGTQASAPQCSPHPCTELDGWKVYVSGIDRSAGRLALDVRFRNDTPGGLFEAVSYRHTSPGDFYLETASTGRIKPTTRDGCPAWREDRIERGAGAGPDHLCFDAPGSTGASELWWNPDTGVLGATGSIPLP